MANDFYKIKSGLNIPTYPDLSSANLIPGLKQGDVVLIDGSVFVYSGSEWIGGAVSSINGQIGAVELKTKDISEDTNLYYTDDRVKTAAIVNSTSGSEIDKAPSVSAVKLYAAQASTLGVASGIATLDTEGKLVSSQLPEVSPSYVGAVDKTGDSMTGNITFSNGTGVESTLDGSVLNMGTTSYTHSVNIATGSHASSINIGTGTGVSTINIGAPGDTVNINGELTYVGVSNLNVSDKDINLNVGGAPASGDSAGIHVEEGGSITGYVHVANSRNSWDIKSPAKSGIVRITPSSDTFNTEIVSSATSDHVLTLPDATGTVALTSQLSNYISTSQKGAASGVATLDVDTKLPLDQLPSLTTADIAEDVSYLYYTDTRAKTATVIDSTSGAEIDKAPSVSAVKSYAIPTSQKGTASGVATLDSDNRLTPSQFPDSIAKAIVADATSTAAGNSGSIRFKELPQNGSNYVSLKAPDLINTNTTWTLPYQDGTVGQVLSTSGLGELQWITSGVIQPTDTVQAAGYALNPSSVNVKVSNYTLTSLDNGRVIVMDSPSAVSLTISSGLPVGFNCMIIQSGLGTVSILSSGTVLNSINGFKISLQHGCVSILSYALNVFNVSGNLTP